VGGGGGVEYCRAASSDKISVASEFREVPDSLIGASRAPSCKQNASESSV
jgi:hypothetical protein